ncbi:MAG: DUF2490 domain-containing protein [Crocinitomicaceae bacterium]|nr:DUF2490 domain-containing protein [Crocinitomicaceae bacterium]
MRILICFFAIAFSAHTFGQHEFETWTKVSADGDVISDLSWSGSVSTRFGNRGVNTFFPQVGLEYKLQKWFRPSVEYRFILDQDKYTNFSAMHRLNFNANFKAEVDRFNISSRLRYQYAFNRGSVENFNPDFDQAIRLRFGVKYNIKKNPITPLATYELFYDPAFSASGPSLSKMRLAIGASVKVAKKQRLSAKYQLDKRFMSFDKNIRHVIALSYRYSL